MKNQLNENQIEVIKISQQNYSQFLSLQQNDRWGNILLPATFSTNLWGYVLAEGSQIVGGWVGILRGNKSILKNFAKSVYFDSYPFFLEKEYCIKYQNLLVDTMCRNAKDEHIVMFNLTHWIRGYNMPYLQKEKNATFLLSLQDTTELQWKMLDGKQRNIVRKGEKNGVEVCVYKGEDAIAKIQILQQLREMTQKHAIKKHAQASMLLKSDEFFSNIFRTVNADLFIGYVQDKPATVALMISSGKTVYYYSGGSDYDLNRQTGCSALVIWKAIEYYREQEGIEYFDMGGVPTLPDKNHPAYGVYEFKRSFGGEYMEFDAGMIVINRFKHGLLKFALSQRFLLRLFSKYI